MDSKKMNNTEDFLESLTSGTDGDLLHISEGMGGEVGFNVSLINSEDDNENEE